MKQAATQQENLSQSVEKTSEQAEPASDSEIFSYAKELRALGQALEAHRISSLDLEIQSGVYVVRGKATPSKEAQSSFSRFVRDFIYGASSAARSMSANSEIDLSYSAQQIEKLESDGRAKRQHSDKMPDPHSLSQILRGAGSYLDNREKTSLVGIAIKDQLVTVRYETAEGRLEQAKQDLEYFYNYWVKMYLRRGNRPKLPPPSAPTLMVSWGGILRRSF